VPAHATASLVARRHHCKPTRATLACVTDAALLRH
jgi:hypothetical protein